MAEHRKSVYAQKLGIIVTRCLNQQQRVAGVIFQIPAETVYVSDPPGMKLNYYKKLVSLNKE